MSDVLKASDGALFIQFTPGKKPEYIGCVDLDAVNEPQGDQTLILCRDGNGDLVTVGSKSGSPGAVTTKVTALTYPESDVLDRIKRCYVTLYALLRVGGKAGLFSNYARADIVHHARVTTRGDENLVKRETEDEVLRTFDISAWNPVYRVRDIKLSPQSIAETTNLNAIAACNVSRCAGPLGAARDACQDLFLGSSAPSGSPTSTADIWQTSDGGTNWSNLTGGAAHPFGGGYDVKAVGCFQLDKTFTRWMAVREQVNSEPLQIAYSDDGGATWAQVTVGSTNNEGAVGGGSLVAIDRDNIWLATTAGNVYHSDDGGATWTLQPDAATAGGNSSLNAIDFADTDNGYAVGDSDTIIVTNDGGATWAAVTSPTTGDNVTAVHVFDAFRVLIGTNADGVYESWDGGATWEAKTFAGQVGTGTIASLSFANDFVGFMVENPASGQGYVYRTIDGGHSWEKMTTPTNAGLNQVVACDENNGYAVGNASGGIGVVLKISD